MFEQFKFLFRTHITGLLIYITLAVYNMTPYSCFRTEISIDEKNLKFTLSRSVDRN